MEVNGGMFLSIDGIQCGQTPTAIDVFSTIIEEFDTIIEIGSGRGGFTTWLYNQNDNIHSYDIKNWRGNVSIPENIFTIGNCFSLTVFRDIVFNIKKDGKTLILCDGGNKELEFNKFSKYLKSGDVIMLHDFANSSDEFSKHKKNLQWATGFESHIDNINTDGLEKYHYELFNSVLWGSFKKH